MVLVRALREYAQPLGVLEHLRIFQKARSQACSWLTGRLEILESQRIGYRRRSSTLSHERVCLWKILQVSLHFL